MKNWTIWMNERIQHRFTHVIYFRNDIVVNGAVIYVTWDGNWSDREIIFIVALMNLLGRQFIYKSQIPYFLKALEISICYSSEITRYLCQLWLTKEMRSAVDLRCWNSHCLLFTNLKFCRKSRADQLVTFLCLTKNRDDWKKRYLVRKSWTLFRHCLLTSNLPVLRKITIVVIRILSWLKSYMYYRSISVVWNKTYSQDEK